MKIVINNINIDKQTTKDNILPELLLEMGATLGFDLEKPVTSAVYILTKNNDIATENAKNNTRTH